MTDGKDILASSFSTKCYCTVTKIRYTIYSMYIQDKINDVHPTHFVFWYKLPCLSNIDLSLFFTIDFQPWS